MSANQCQSCGGTLSKIGIALYICDYCDSLHFMEKGVVRLMTEAELQPSVLKAELAVLKDRIEDQLKRVGKLEFKEVDPAGTLSIFKVFFYIFLGLGMMALLFWLPTLGLHGLYHLALRHHSSFTHGIYLATQSLIKPLEGFAVLCLATGGFAFYALIGFLMDRKRYANVNPVMDQWRTQKAKNELNKLHIAYRKLEAELKKRATGPAKPPAEKDVLLERINCERCGGNLEPAPEGESMTCPWCGHVHDPVELDGNALLEHNQNLLRVQHERAQFLTLLNQAQGSLARLESTHRFFTNAKVILPVSVAIPIMAFFCLVAVLVGSFIEHMPFELRNLGGEGFILAIGFGFFWSGAIMVETILYPPKRDKWLTRVKNLEEIVQAKSRVLTINMPPAKKFSKTPEPLAAKPDLDDPLEHQIVTVLIEKFQEETGIDLRQDPMAVKRMQEAAAKAKQELKSKENVTIDLQFIAGDEKGPRDLSLKLKRSRTGQ
jgi:hypothetical protein